jgi:hypothetical protein
MIVRVAPNEETKSDDSQCRATVRTQNGKIVFAKNWPSIRILDVSGKDVNGDGQPDAVFEAYGGGAHCCWTYWIVSLGDSPGLIREIYNQRDAKFEQSPIDGRIIIHTVDGSFDYFENLAHSFSTFPSVYLRLDGHDLKRIDEEFWPRYAAEIQEAKSKLNKLAINEFRKAGPITGEMTMSKELEKVWALEETEENILTIVLAYLYGGRPDLAWKALHEYWPPQNEQDIREEILATARSGFLGDTSRSRYGILE